MFRTTGSLNPEAMLRKGIYDKIAAGLILEKFVKFYNSEELKMNG